jgi:nickel-type superoxide dismutase maturation protease
MSLGTLLPKHPKRPRRAILDIIRWGFGRRLRFLVHGNSMLPTLKSGISVLVSTTQHPKAEDIVVVMHPQKIDLVLIKRCVQKTEQGLWLEGDNPEKSTDSRQLGWFPKRDCIGVVTSII